MKYTPVIGLEVHVELKTKSKMFCSCSADYFGKEPNSHTCPVCLGLPGALPVPNKTAIEWCVMIGLALNCEISLSAKFDRKNYFYPDLAKGYQISQYDEPFAINGYVILESKATPESPSLIMTQRDAGQASMTEKKIRIRRVHMEEDTAKLTHQQRISLIDFNRSGVPLVEIVTEPDFDSAEQVIEYLKKLQQIVRYLNVSNADMEKGDMRLEPNISLRELKSQNSKVKTEDLPPYKVEVKNINSFRFVEKAIDFEVERQAKILDEGKTPAQETRGWNEAKNSTVSQRIKEEANDYRYFPEPDIPPVRWTEFQISNFKSQMPEMPDIKLKRFQDEHELGRYDAEILTRDKEMADYSEKIIKISGGKLTSKQIANWIINKKVVANSIAPEELLKHIASATQVATVDAKELKEVIKTVLLENEKAVEDYKSGKENVIMFLVGQTMRKIGKKINTQMVKDNIKELI